MGIFPSTVPQPQNCSSISNQGSILLVGELQNCADEPAVITITANAAVAVNATTMTITTDATADFYLRKGAVLTFGTSPTPPTVTVTAETLVASGVAPVTIPIEAATVAITANLTATTWGLLKVLAPQTLPINEEASTTDTTDLTFGLQGSETVVKLMLNPQVQIISRLDDRAYHGIISKAAKVGGTIFCAFVLSDTSHVFGRAVVSGNNKEFTQSDINKPTFNLLMQAPWYSYLAFAYETPANKTVINRARLLSGLPTI